MTQNIDEIIILKLREVIGSCDIDNGYIIDVKSEYTVHDNKILYTSVCEFDIEFKAEILKPKIDDKLKGIITYINDKGIYVKIHEMNVFLPSNFMTGFEYDNDQKNFKKGKILLELDDKILVVIKNIKYDNNNYICIASYKSKFKKSLK